MRSSCVLIPNPGILLITTNDIAKRHSSFLLSKLVLFIFLSPFLFLLWTGFRYFNKVKNIILFLNIWIGDRVEEQGG